MTTERLGRLSEEEYKAFQEWYGYRGPGKYRFGIGMPQNEPGIRANKHYQQWLEVEPQGARVTQTTKRIWEEKIGEPLPEGVEAAPESHAEKLARMRREQEEAEDVYDEEDIFGRVARVEVIQEGGYDYEVSFDAEGKSIGMTRIGPSLDREDLGPTGADVGRERLEWEKEQYGTISESERRQRATQEREAAKTRQFQARTQMREEQQQERMIGWYREQAGMEQQEMERQHMAQLASQPISWLQYAAYTGQQPVVQPWMQPLMPQQYGMETGQAIPGWTPQSAQGMPELTRPSAQLWSRMGPSQQQQYQGYRQARTGASPADVDWRRRAAAPPSGSRRSLSWMR